ncbi:GNAT family N-acetyltransferase [Clostridium estertheticum]|uniref:GNAT family N-acetyltransferase n=1 Tax=Clostridium estertheticum TaxID=238834 RepID=UPI0013E95E3D|nr:GNAT family N-acetyltransferase [Clostridium estertheticum]MBZ9687458.1 GNAT family N-acetyltransferase [Clostridium estertheticum]
MLAVKLVESIKKIDELRGKYINDLSYSQEFYIEDMVRKSSCYQIYLNNNLVGYFFVNQEKVLVEFYLEKKEMMQSQYIFKFLIEKHYFASAEAKSFDHLLMALCLDFKKNSSCTGYLFRDFNNVNCSLSIYDNLHFEIAEQEDVKKITEISEDFFLELESNIYRQEVFTLYSNDNLLGAGICQKIVGSLSYYDIGMVVSKEHQNKGVGTYIISKLKEHCISKDLVPVCGCDYYNYASKKTLEKAGFITKHRIVRFEFQDL